MPHEQSRIAASDAKKSAVAAISGEADARCVKARAKFIFCDVTKTLAKWAVIGAPAPKTMEALCQAAKLERCDYLALGAYGRKGEQLEHMGSTAESALFLLTGIVTMTVKNQCTVPELSAPKKFLVCSDDGAASKKALEQLLHDFVRPTDEVTILHLADEEPPSFVPRYTEILHKAGVTAAKVLVQGTNGERVSSCIIKVAEEVVGADYVVIGSQLTAAQQSSGVVGDVCTRVRRECQLCCVVTYAYRPGKL